MMLLSFPIPYKNQPSPFNQLFGSVGKYQKEHEKKFPFFNFEVAYIPGDVDVSQMLLLETSLSSYKVQ